MSDTVSGNDEAGVLYIPDEMAAFPEHDDEQLADALHEAVLTGQVRVPVIPPVCEDHREVQHRDGKGPWCQLCGWTRGRPAIPPSRVR